MILIDTSAWIAFFRGTGPVDAIVDRALEADDAVVCGPVLTELRRGLKSVADRRKVLPLLVACHLLPQPAELWNEAGDLGFALARRGVTVKTLDLLIATYALASGVPLLTLDRDFRAMKRAGAGLHLLDY